jgi:hypothetical protein
LKKKLTTRIDEYDFIDIQTIAKKENLSLNEMIQILIKDKVYGKSANTSLKDRLEIARVNIAEATARIKEQQAIYWETFKSAPSSRASSAMEKIETAPIKSLTDAQWNVVFNVMVNQAEDNSFLMCIHEDLKCQKVETMRNHILHNHPYDIKIALKEIRDP